MNLWKPLIVCLGFVMVLPALAAEDYSSLRPKGYVETAPELLGKAELIEATASVEDIDYETRLVTLKGSEGGLFTIQAGPEVKNLAQVKAGDLVLVKYYQSIAVDVVTPADAGAKPGMEGAVVTAEPGAAPAGAAVVRKRKTVEILSVDPYKKSIAFRDADGRWREMLVDRPDLEHFLKDLKEGDKVEVTFTEALAIAVEAQ